MTPPLSLEGLLSSVAFCRSIEIFRCDFALPGIFFEGAGESGELAQNGRLH